MNIIAGVCIIVGIIGATLVGCAWSAAWKDVQLERARPKSIAEYIGGAQNDDKN